MCIPNDNRRLSVDVNGKVGFEQIMADEFIAEVIQLAPHSASDVCYLTI